MFSIGLIVVIGLVIAFNSYAIESSARKPLFRRRLGLTKPTQSKPITEITNEVSNNEIIIKTSLKESITNNIQVYKPKLSSKVITNLNYNYNAEKGDDEIDNIKPIKLEDIDDDSVESFLDNLDGDTNNNDNEVSKTSFQRPKRGDKFIAQITRFGHLGMSVDAENGKLNGLILQQELDFFRNSVDSFNPLIGDTIAVYVQNIRDDGKLDLSLRPIGFDKFQSSSDTIIAVLKKATNNTLPLGDRSLPDDIKRLIPGMSKNVYKAGISALLRDGAIELTENTMTLIPENKRNKVIAAPYDGKTPRGFKPTDATTIFISNFPYETTEQELAECIEDKLGFGHLAKLKLATDRATGRPAGYGYANFFTPDQAIRAIKMLQGIEVNGRQIRAASNIKSQTSLKHEFKAKKSMRDSDDEDLYSSTDTASSPRQRDRTASSSTRSNDSDDGEDGLDSFFADEQPSVSGKPKPVRAEARNGSAGEWRRKDDRTDGRSEGSARADQFKSHTERSTVIDKYSSARDHPPRYESRDRDRGSSQGRDSYSRDSRDNRDGRDGRRRDGPSDRRGGDERSSYRKSANPAQQPFSVFVGGLPYSATESLVQQSIEASLTKGAGAIHDVSHTYLPSCLYKNLTHLPFYCIICTYVFCVDTISPGCRDQANAWLRIHRLHNRRRRSPRSD